MIPVVSQLARWRRIDRPGLEALTVERREGVLAVRGDLILVLDDGALEVDYRLTYSLDWRFLRGAVRSTEGSVPRTLEFVRGDAEDWRVDGAPRPDLAGCSDVDLMVTPFTNTPPLWRLDPPSGAACSLRVAWVRFPELTVTPVRQEYVRLGEVEPPKRFLYRNLETGFEDELEVDEHRLVVAYGPWRGGHRGSERLQGGDPDPSPRRRAPS